MLMISISISPGLLQRAKVPASNFAGGQATKTIMATKTSLKSAFVPFQI